MPARQGVAVLGSKRKKDPDHLSLGNLTMASLQMERNLTQEKNPKSPAPPPPPGRSCRSCQKAAPTHSSLGESQKLSFLFILPLPTPANTVKPPSCKPGFPVRVLQSWARGKVFSREGTKGILGPKLSASPVHCSPLFTPVFKRLLPRMDWVLVQLWSNPPALPAPLSYFRHENNCTV